MNTLTISTVLALSAIALTGPAPTFAATQAEVSGRSLTILETGFKQLSTADRIQVQRELAAYNFYGSTLDGLWGRNTAHALRQALGLMEHNMGHQIDLSSSSEVQSFLGRFIDGSASAFIWGEGEECDGCGDTQEAAQPLPHTLVSVPSGFQCNGRPSELHQADRLVKQASDQFSLGNDKAYLELRAQVAYYGGPKSSEIVANVALGGSERFAGYGFAPELPPETIASCLHFASDAGLAVAKVWLARAYAGDESLPHDFLTLFTVDIDKAGTLMDCAYNAGCSRGQNRSTFEAPLQVVVERVAEQEARKHAVAVVTAKRQAEALKQKCNGLTSLKGICWAQTVEEMKIVLLSQDYSCGVDIIGTTEVCGSEEARVWFLSDEFVFNCEAFNACPFDHTDISQMLLQQGLVGSMETGRDLVTQQDLLDRPFELTNLNTRVPYWQLTSCGKGPQGQELCVEQPDNSPIRLSLRKGIYGAAAPLFE